MRQNVNRAYENLIAQLRTIRRQWRWLTFSLGMLKCVGILALVMTVVPLILTLSLRLWQSPFSRWVSIGIVLISIGIAIYTVVRTLVLPLRRKLTNARVAALLESAQTESEFASENRVLSAVQLQKALGDNRLGYAPEFIEQLILQASRDMEQVQGKPSVSDRVSEIQAKPGDRCCRYRTFSHHESSLTHCFHGFCALVSGIAHNAADRLGRSKRPHPDYRNPARERPSRAKAVMLTSLCASTDTSARLSNSITASAKRMLPSPQPNGNPC